MSKHNSTPLNEGLDQFSTSISSYGYSAQPITSLQDTASEFTLVTLAVDTSGSVGGFESLIEDMIGKVVSSCKLSPRADNLMIRVVYFNSTVNEIHGFKLLGAINPSDYKGTVRAAGLTALAATAHSSIEAMAAYAKTLMAQDYMSNGLLVVITDGLDNSSGNITASKIAAALKQVTKDEDLESLNSILIGLVNPGDTFTDGELKKFKTEAGFSQYENAGDLSGLDPKHAERRLAKLADFISKSVSAQSSSLGSGGPSKALPLTI